MSFGASNDRIRGNRGTICGSTIISLYGRDWVRGFDLAMTRIMVS